MIKIKEYDNSPDLATVGCDSCYGDGMRTFYLTPEQDAVVQTLAAARGTENALPTIQAALDLGVKQAVVAHALGMSRANLAIILRKARGTR